MINNIPQKDPDPSEINAEVISETRWRSRFEGSEGKEIVEAIYSNDIPKLKISVANTFREIEVGYSSIEQENNRLLHLLFKQIST